MTPSNNVTEIQDDDSKIFPQRLMEVLTDESNSSAICWLPHGKAFIIRDRQLFAEQVMPKFFPRKAKYSSFTRKLNRWNFVRVSSGPEIGAYYHEFFVRDKPHLAAQMFCKNVRSKLAMANLETGSGGPAPSSAPVLQSAPQETKMPGMLSQYMIAAMNKGQVDAKFNLPFGNGLGGNSNLQLIQQQIQILQQEQAQRLLLERLALSNQPMANVATLSPQEIHLLQLRQLMQQRTREPPQRSPTNPRASAA